MSEMLVWVICSCGRRTLLHCPAHGICSPEDPTWRYHSAVDIAEGEDRSRLWHCGQEGHFQAMVANYSCYPDQRNPPCA